MTKTRVIRVFSFIMALTLVFAMCTSPAYALRPQQFGAWIAAAIQAINITVGSTLIPAAELGQKFSDYLNYPVKINATQMVDVPYTFTDADIQAELDKSVIQIDKDTVTIDGVKYTDVWLSNDAAEKFRVNAFDLENAFDITSQSEGTFASGVGTIGRHNVFRIGDNYQTQSILYESSFNTPFPILSWTDKVTGDSNQIQLNRYKDNPNSQYWNLRNWSTWNPYWTTQVSGLSDSDASFKVKFTAPVSTEPTFQYFITSNSTGNILYRSGWISQTKNGFVSEPFDFDWVSGTIPADSPLANDEGLRIRVPTEAVNQWYVDNPSFGPNVTINMGDPELSTKIDDLIDLIVPLIPVLDIDFTKAPEPAPEPEPIPDPDPYPDPLPDPDISLIDSTLKDIIQALKNIFDNISIGNSLTTAIKNLTDQIKWVLDDILDKIGDLVDKIVRGNLDWFSDIIDAIKTPFLPWLNIFKLGVNIWHYVVTWVQNISAPFSYFWNILGNISTIFYSPIYAVAAASIVIAIYRRFGR